MQGGGGGNEAVSSVVGTMLMLGLTVVVFTAVSIGVLNTFSHQSQTPRTEISALQQGSQYLLVHKGGESLAASGLTVRVNVNGVELTLPASTFASAVGTSWNAGDSICLAGPVPPCVYASGTVRGSQVIASSTLVSGDGAVGITCPTDTTAPTVQTWVQTPSQVQSTTVGSVSVTATLTDACYTPDARVAPHLFSRINPGSNPAYTDQGAMTRVTGDQWTKSIPDPTWASQTGKQLQYYISPMTDLGGNSGSSPTQSQTVLLDCTPDVSPPTVQTLTQNPTTLQTTTTGAVTVTVTLTDTCWGVDETALPHLLYSLAAAPGTPVTDTGAMTHTATSTWQGTIPAQAWAGSGLKYLNHQVTGMKDLHGNAGSSGVTSSQVGNIPVPDPGFPFVDKDGDALYKAATDVQLANSAVTGGTYNAGVDGLVIPPSVGAISAGAITFTAGDAATDKLSISVALTATTGKLTLASPGDITLAAVAIKTLTSTQDISAISCGTFTATGATVTSADQVTITCNKDITVTGGAWTAPNTGKALYFTSNNGKVTLNGGMTGNSDGDTQVMGLQAVDVSGATFTTTGTSDNIIVKSTGSTVTAASTTLNPKGVVTFTSATGMEATGLKVTTSGGTVSLTATGGLLNLPSATITPVGALTLSGQSMVVDSATLTTTGSGNAISATSTSGTMSATSAVFTSTGSTTLQASGAMTLTNSRIATSSSASVVSVTSTTSSIAATGATWSAISTLSATAQTSLTLGGSFTTGSGGSANQLLTLKATTGALSASSGTTITSSGGTTITAGTSVALASTTVKHTTTSDTMQITASNGNIDVQSATLDANTGNALATVTNPSNVLANLATFKDANNKLDVTPNANHTGTPTSGGFE